MPLPALVALMTSPTWWLLLSHQLGEALGARTSPSHPSPAPCLPPGWVCSCIPAGDATCILPSQAGGQNEPAARQDPAPSQRHGHPAELASAPVLRQLPGSPAGIWGAAAWPALPAEPVPFPQKEKSSSRFNLESLKSQTLCQHRQVGTGQAVARHWGPLGIPTGVPGPWKGGAGSHSPAPPPRNPAPLHRGQDAAPLTLLLPPRLGLGTDTAWHLS